MNAKMKRRMIAVGGVIVIVVILLLAVLGGGNAAKVVTVAEAADGSYADKKVQVTGTVVDNSYSVDADGVLTFSIADEDDVAQATTVTVVYDKGVSATFGNGVTAICTGRMGSDTTLTCTELVTKCPSKYENADTALSVSKLLSYDSADMVGNTVKIAGTVQTLGLATDDVRLVLADADDSSATVDIVYSGAISGDVAQGSSVVITGALQDDGSFLASDVALEG